MRMATGNVGLCLPILNELLPSLSYSTARNPEFQKLSRIGGHLWLLTYAIQHLIDPAKVASDEDDSYYSTNADLSIGIGNISALLQDLAAATQALLPLTETFFTNAKGLREAAVEIVKKVKKQYTFSRDPFQHKLHPEVKVKCPRSRTNVKLAKALHSDKVRHNQTQAEPSSDTTQVSDRVIQDLTLEVQWSTLTILVQGMASLWD
jgi:hypothetical protein